LARRRKAAEEEGRKQQQQKEERNRERERESVMRKVRDGLYIGNITDAAAVLSSAAADSSRRLSPAAAAVTHLLSLISRGINPLDFKRPAHIPDPDQELQQAAGEQPCTPIPSSSSSSSPASSSPGNSKLKKLTVPLLDSQSQNLLDHLDECLEFIESGRKDGGIVLVHCFAGVSRRQATKPSSSASSSSSSSPILPLFYYISSMDCFMLWMLRMLLCNSPFFLSFFFVSASAFLRLRIVH
jgi:dual specificity phosphatase 12